MFAHNVYAIENVRYVCDVLWMWVACAVYECVSVYKCEWHICMNMGVEICMNVCHCCEHLYLSGLCMGMCESVHVSVGVTVKVYVRVWACECVCVSVCPDCRESVLKPWPLGGNFLPHLEDKVGLCVSGAVNNFWDSSDQHWTRSPNQQCELSWRSHKVFGLLGFPSWLGTVFANQFHGHRSQKTAALAAARRPAALSYPFQVVLASLPHWELGPRGGGRRGEHCRPADVRARRESILRKPWPSAMAWSRF